MKRLLSIALVLLVFTSCEKEKMNEQFLGYWKTGEFTLEDGTHFESMVRFFSEDKLVYISGFTYDYSSGVVKSQAETIQSNYTCGNQTVSNYAYQMGTFTPAPYGTCKNTGYKFYNISARLMGDTLVENGTYDVYIDGEIISATNTYTVKFTKI